MDNGIMVAAETGNFLTGIVEMGKSILDMAVSTGTQLLSLPIVQVFVAITLVGVSIRLISKGIHSMN